MCVYLLHEFIFHIEDILPANTTYFLALVMDSITLVQSQKLTLRSSIFRPWCMRPMSVVISVGGWGQWLPPLSSSPPNSLKRGSHRIHLGASPTRLVHPQTRCLQMECRIRLILYSPRGSMTLQSSPRFS